jgi:large subunit ribosomal protein L31
MVPHVPAGVAHIALAAGWFVGYYASPRGRRGAEAVMKQGIHPEYHEVEVHCACGNTFKTHSTKKEIRLEICSACHPLFTGKQKLIDSAGMVERFQRRYRKGEKATNA